MELILYLISTFNYKVLLLNGKTTSIKILEKYFRIERKDYSTFVLRETTRVKGYYTEIDELLGVKLKNLIKIFGWNDYINRNQSSIEIITNWIRTTLKQDKPMITS